MPNMLRSTLSLFWRGLIYLAFLSICIELALQAFYWITAGDFLFRRVGLPIYAREPHAGFGNRPGLSFDHRTNEFHAHYYINQAGFRVPRPDLSVDGTVRLQKLDDVIFVGRPAFGQEESTITLFKLQPDGEAHRTKVVLGRSSVNTIEIREGLQPGDQVVLSDMSAYDQFDRVRLN